MRRGRHALTARCPVCRLPPGGVSMEIVINGRMTEFSADPRTSPLDLLRGSSRLDRLEEGVQSGHCFPVVKPSSFSGTDLPVKSRAAVPRNRAWRAGSRPRYDPDANEYATGAQGAQRREP